MTATYPAEPLPTGPLIIADIDAVVPDAFRAWAAVVSAQRAENGQRPLAFRYQITTHRSAVSAMNASISPRRSTVSCASVVANVRSSSAGGSSFGHCNVKNVVAARSTSPRPISHW